jgi:hypothetical protein
MSSGALHRVALVRPDVSTVTLLWKRITLKDEDDIFTETSVLTTTTWCNAPEDIRYC